MPVATRVRSGTGAASSGMPQFGQTAASSETFIPQFGHDCHVPSAIRFPLCLCSPSPHRGDGHRSFPPNIPPCHFAKRLPSHLQIPSPSQSIGTADEPGRKQPHSRPDPSTSTTNPPATSRPIDATDNPGRKQPHFRPDPSAPSTNPSASHPHPARIPLQPARNSQEMDSPPLTAPLLCHNLHYLPHTEQAAAGHAPPKKGAGNHHEH